VEKERHNALEMEKKENAQRKEKAQNESRKALVLLMLLNWFNKRGAMG